jgi:hypothetical protein
MIVVYDDVFTDGFTLREVARCLIRVGDATVVCSVTLTRQPSGCLLRQEASTRGARRPRRCQ